MQKVESAESVQFFKIFCEQNIEISTCAEKIAEHLDIDLIICISDSCEVEFLIALLPFI